MKSADLLELARSLLAFDSIIPLMLENELLERNLVQELIGYYFKIGDNYSFEKAFELLWKYSK